MRLQGVIEEQTGQLKEKSEQLEAQSARIADLTKAKDNQTEDKARLLQRIAELQPPKGWHALLLHLLTTLGAATALFLLVGPLCYGVSGLPWTAPLPDGTPAVDETAYGLWCWAIAVLMASLAVTGA